MIFQPASSGSSGTVSTTVARTASCQVDDLHRPRPRAFDLEHGPVRRNPIGEQRRFIGRQHGVLRVEELSCDAALEQCEVDAEVGLLDHRAQTLVGHGLDEIVRDLRQEPWTVHSEVAHQLDVEPAGPVDEGMQFVAEVAVLVLLARAARTPFVATGHRWRAQRREGCDLLGELAGEPGFGEQRLVLRVEVDVDVDAGAFEERTRHACVTAVRFDRSEIGEHERVAGVGRGLEQPDCVGRSSRSCGVAGPEPGDPAVRIVDGCESIDQRVERSAQEIVVSPPGPCSVADVGIAERRRHRVEVAVPLGRLDERVESFGLVGVEAEFDRGAMNPILASRLDRRFAAITSPSCASIQAMTSPMTSACSGSFMHS